MQAEAGPDAYRFCQEISKLSNSSAPSHARSYSGMSFLSDIECALHLDARGSTGSGSGSCMKLPWPAGSIKASESTLTQSVRRHGTLEATCCTTTYDCPFAVNLMAPASEAACRWTFQIDSVAAFPGTNQKMHSTAASH